MQSAEASGIYFYVFFQNWEEIIISRFSKLKNPFKKILRNWNSFRNTEVFEKQPPEVLYKKAVLKSFAIFTGKKTPVLDSLFNKFAGMKACKFIKKRLQHRCFPVFSCEYCETFKNTYFEEHRLFLDLFG